MTTYQDVIIGGKVQSRGARLCDVRYQALRPLLSQYKRPITVLDLGAGEGYFSFSIAREFNSVVVMVDDSQHLQELASVNNLDNVIHLKHRVSPLDLFQLSFCEHFDVVLALSVLHHFENWQSAAEAVFQLGDNIFIEVPNRRESTACNYEVVPALNDWLDERKGDHLISTPSHTGPFMRSIKLYRGDPKPLSRSYWDVPVYVPWGGLTITSSLTKKTVTFHGKPEHRDWVPGINLRTYQNLNGVYPSADDISDLVLKTPLPQPPHMDIKPWNFILGGRIVTLIDGRDNRGMTPDEVSLHETARDIRGGWSPVESILI